MGYKQPNNPMKMMKSALKMHKAEKKAGMHRNSAMYMGHSPMEMGHSPMEMGHSPMEMGHDSPAKNMNKGYGQEVKSPMKRESAELKDMPIVDIEKGKAKGDMKKGSPAKMGHDKNDDSPANHYFDPMHKQHRDDHKPKKPKKKGSPAKAAKPDYIDIDGDGNKEESMKQAAKDKKKDSPAKMGHKKSPAKMGHKDSPAKKYDRVVLGGNKGDKSKTKPGKKDYEK